MSDPNITGILLASLRRQSGRFPREAHDIEVAIAALELRRAFTLMSRLKEHGIWDMTPDEEAALEDFWWEYGQ